jgi:hypothetical protein
LFKVVNDAYRFNGPAALSDLAISPHRIYVWHCPDGLAPPSPQELGGGKLRITQVMNLGDSDKCLVRCSDLSHVLVPHIDKVLL